MIMQERRQSKAKERILQKEVEIWNHFKKLFLFPKRVDSDVLKITEDSVYLTRLIQQCEEHNEHVFNI